MSLAFPETAPKDNSSSDAGNLFEDKTSSDLQALLDVALFSPSVAAGGVFMRSGDHLRLLVASGEPESGQFPVSLVNPGNPASSWCFEAITHETGQTEANAPNKGQLPELVLGLSISSIPHDREAVSLLAKSVASAARGLLEAVSRAADADARLDATRAATEHFEYVTELAGVGGWEIDPSTTKVTWTEQTCRIHDAPVGYAPSLEEWFNLCEQSAQQSLRVAYREACRSGTGWRMDLRVKTSTGRRIWVSSLCQPVYQSDGSIKLVGSIMDVSSRKAAELEIDRTQRLYRSTLNALSEAILVTDKDGIVRWHNGAAEEILDCETIYENMTHLSDVVCDLQPADLIAIGRAGVLETDASLLTALLAAKQTRELTLQVRVGDQRALKWVKCRSEPLASREEGEFVGMVISLEDITELKRSEDILNEAFEAVPNGFAVFDQDDRLVMANSAYRSVLMEGRLPDAGKDTYRDLLRRNLEKGRFVNAPVETEARHEWLERRLSDYLTPAAGYLELLDDGRWIQSSSRITPSSYRADFFSDVSEIKNHGAVLEAVFENLPGGVALFDKDRNLTMFNSGIRQLLDMDDAFIKSRPTLRSMIARNAAREGLSGAQLEQAVDRTIARFSNVPKVVYERTLKDGTVHEIRVVALPDGGLLTALDDITLRKQQEQQLKQSERQAQRKSSELELALANMEQGISVFDSQCRLQVWNQKYVDIFRKDASEIYRGVPFAELLEAERRRGDFDGDVEAHIEDLRQRLASGEVVRAYFRLSSGRLICSIHAPMPGGGWIGTHDEVEEDDPEYQAHRKKRQIDPVTGEANEALFLEDAELVLNGIQVRGGHGALMVISPGYGSAYDRGEQRPLDDRSAYIMGRRIRECVRPTDLVARLRDGRFAVLYPSISGDREALTSIAGRMLDLLDAPFVIDGEKHLPATHIGLVRIDRQTKSVRTAIADARVASGRAFGGGRTAYIIA